jgi:desulfoferrodoxin (superoxide reductase-like protein)
MDKKKSLIFYSSLIILLVGLWVPHVYADIPKMLSIEFNDQSKMLEMEIQHLRPSSTHYVDKIEVEVNGNAESIDISEAQTSTPFTVTYQVTEKVSSLRVRAHCNLHGWSQWIELESDQETNVGEIPGFPSISIFLGLIILIYFNSYRFQRNI